MPKKLLQIRNAFGISQSEMLRRLGFGDVIIYNGISEYELGKNEPPLPILLEYARVAGVHVEDLINDNVDLPDKLPGRVRHRD